MTPDEHADGALRLLAELDDAPRATSDQLLTTALAALTHAVLALRPAGPVEVAAVEAVPEVTAEPIHVDPAKVTGYGALIEATFHKERLRAFLADPASVLSWMVPGREAYHYEWAADYELTNALLLNPGEPS